MLEMNHKGTKMILDFDFKTLNEFAKTHKTVDAALLKEHPSIKKELAKIAATRSFVSHALAILALPQPWGNSLADTYTKARDAYTIEGRTVLKEEILELIRFFRSYSFGQYTNFTQTTCEFNSATPLVLYAQRLYNDRTYEHWTKEASTAGFLGKSLADIFKVKFPVLDEDVYENARVESVTDLKGNRNSFHVYKANKTGIEEVDSLPRFFKHMYLKTWIFAEPKSSMIIDLDNWDAALNIKNNHDPKPQESWINDLPF